MKLSNKNIRKHERRISGIDIYSKNNSTVK